MKGPTVIIALVVTWVVSMAIMPWVIPSHERMCPRGWWTDMDEPVMVPCKTLHPGGDE